MSRTASYLILVAGFALVVSGCPKRGPNISRPRRGRGRVGRRGPITGIDFDRYWPREEVVKLTSAQRAELLELSLAGMKGNNWAHAGDVLVALGKGALPALIKQVDNSEATAAASGPLPVTDTKTLGELSHDILLRSIQYHSNYRGQLPVRKKAAWEEWWKQNQASLKIK